MYIYVCFCGRSQGSYNASKHPEVIAQQATEEEVLEEFLSTFEGEVKDGKVTLRAVTVAVII